MKYTADKMLYGHTGTNCDGSVSYTGSTVAGNSSLHPGASQMELNIEADASRVQGEGDDDKAGSSDEEN